MRTRLEYLQQEGLEGAKLGLVSIEWLIKYDGYLTFIEELEMAKKQKADNPRAEAIKLAADKLKCDRSTISRYIYAFERYDGFSGQVIINRSGPRWISNFSPFANNGKHMN